MILTIALTTDPPRDVAARELSGYHRPLNGESANLTMVLDVPRAERSDWSAPPLGVAAAVYADGALLLEGTLTRVVWTLADLTVGIEG